MGEQRPLWSAGGTRGVNDVGQVARTNATERSGRALGAKRLVVGIQADDLGVIGRQPGQQPLLSQQHRHLGIGEHEGQPLLRISRVQRHVGSSRFENAQETHHHLQ